MVNGLYNITCHALYRLQAHLALRRLWFTTHNDEVH